MREWQSAKDKIPLGQSISSGPRGRGYFPSRARGPPVRKLWGYPCDEGPTVELSVASVASQWVPDSPLPMDLCRAPPMTGGSLEHRLTMRLSAPYHQRLISRVKKFRCYFRALRRHFGPREEQLLSL